MQMENKKFILFDIDKSLLEDYIQNHEYYYFDANTKYAKCIGCFGCWLKTPSKCVMKDKVYGVSDFLSDIEEFVIISKCKYGMYSKEVKGVVDRLIAFNLPFFKVRNRELHHVPRYKNELKVKVIYYGAFNEKEKDTAFRYSNANGHNFNSKSVDVYFVNDEKEARDKLCEL